MSPRVALVTGRAELGCGVADYSVRLAGALEAAGASVDVVTADRWGPRSVGEVHRRLAALHPDIVHLQYPTASYRTSLAPHALSLREPRMVVTLHEASQAHPLRQASLLALLARPARVVFTSAAERDHMIRLAPWVRARSEVIPIGSAIPVSPAPGSTERRVAYFGLLTPEKGLDDVLTVAGLAAATAPGVRVLVVGRAEPRYPDLPATLQRRARDLPVDWALDRGADEVAALLAASAVGYLPFPDGASERRSSLLALLVNGVPTVTTPGPFVDDDLAGAVELAAGPDEAWAALDRLLADESRRETVGDAARTYGRARDWATIAERHLATYERLLERGRVPAGRGAGGPADVVG